MRIILCLLLAATARADFLPLEAMPTPSPMVISANEAHPPPDRVLLVFESGKSVEIDASGVVYFRGGARPSEAAQVFWAVVSERMPWRAELDALKKENAQLRRKLKERK